MIKMDFQSPLEPVTPAPYEDGKNASFWRTEDSGYHTSYTPSSMECSELLNENHDPNIIRYQESNRSTEPRRKFRRYKWSSSSSHRDSSFEISPKRRGVKRAYQDDTDVLSSAATPTSVIAGGIERLKVNESLISPASTVYSGSVSRNLFALECTSYTSYPTTPVKRSRTSIKTSPTRFNDSCNTSPLMVIDNLSCPPRRSAKKLNFANHSLLGEIQTVSKHKIQSKVVRTIFRPEQKIDIIKMLYLKVCTMPAINKILSYLSNEDIFNFSLVSPIWLKICEDNAKTKKKEYVDFITNTKENHGNRKHNHNDVLSKSLDNTKVAESSLKDIHNIVNSRAVKKSPVRSPPTTPKTRRFKTFTKAASLDSRIQMSCVRCRHPAKVTEEATGEEWVECTSASCSYQFCRYCKCNRHPNRVCFRYDLEGPSPSKRKKKVSGIGTKKSKKDLRRLLQ